MATDSHNTSGWPGKLPEDDARPSCVAKDFERQLGMLEYVQTLEATHAVIPFSLKAADALDERWMDLRRRTSPATAPLPTRLGDAALLQARMLLHLAVQVNDADEHATICTALYDLTRAAVDRVPPKVHALLERVLIAVEDGHFPTVYPEDRLTLRG